MKGIVTVHCNNSVGRRCCFQYPTCWVIKQENHEGKGRIIAYVKKITYKMSHALKFRCRHADADLKLNIEGYNYLETTLVYIYIKEAKHLQLNVSMC